MQKIKSIKKKPPLEKEIQKAILEHLKGLGLYVWINKTQGTFDPKARVFRKNKHNLNGVPDILGILPNGKFLGIEVKRPKTGKVSPDQQEFIDRAVSLGAVCFVARSVDDVIEKLII